MQNEIGAAWTNFILTHEFDIVITKFDKLIFRAISVKRKTDHQQTIRRFPLPFFKFSDQKNCVIYYYKYPRSAADAHTAQCPARISAKITKNTYEKLIKMNYNCENYS